MNLSADPSPGQSRTATIWNSHALIDEKAIKAHLDHIMLPGFAYEIRVKEAMIPHGASRIQRPPIGKEGYKGNYAGYFDNPESVITELRNRVLNNISVYVCPNPLDKAFLSKADHLQLAPSAVRDDDVKLLRWLLIDVDPDRPVEGISATNDERALARELWDRVLTVRDDIRDSSIWGSSGNGYFILLRLPDRPNTEENRAKLKSYLKDLHNQFSEFKGAKVDPGMFNPSRLTPLPGTYKCKGVHTAERPWRMATLESEVSRCPL